MLMIPIETPDHTEDTIIIILDDTSLARMAAADPPEVILRQCGKTLVNPSILICHQNSNPEFARLLQSRDLPAIIHYLQRGWKYCPDKGDHDNGPRRLSGLN